MQQYYVLCAHMIAEYHLSVATQYMSEWAVRVLSYPLPYHYLQG